MASSDGLIFYWGNYQHPVKEVYPKLVTTSPIMTSRGQRWARDVRMVVGGDLINVSTPAEVMQRIRGMENAYSQDYRDCGFLMNGVATPHRLLNDDPQNLSGNQSLGLKWTNRYPTEYLNTRSFEVEIRAIYLNGYSRVIDFHEEIVKIGDGGPKWRLYDTVNGPVRVPTTLNSKVIHVQRGFVIGAGIRLLPPSPVWPNEEQRWRRRITYHNPVYVGNPANRPPAQYRTDYVYYFERLGPDARLGNNWYS